MSRNYNERNRNLERPIPGCLGRMVNLFDLNIGVGGNRLLTDKPHFEGSPVSRSQSDVSRSRVVDDQMHDKEIVYEFEKPSFNKKLSGTPIKMLIAQEMSKEEPPKQGSPNLVAKLMGLDDLPQQHQPGSASCRTNSRSKSRFHSGSSDLIPKEHEEANQYKDVFEIWQQSCKSGDELQQKGRKRKESKNEKTMALIREKFIEAKRLSTDEKLRESKQFQDALEVLNSNKDLFLKFLQEPNSLFSQHQYLQSVPPPPDSKCITVLKPSKLLDAHKLPTAGKKNTKQLNEITWDKFNGHPTKPNPPTRIVVLKPSTGKPSSLITSNDEGFYGDLEDNEPKESTLGIPECPSGHRRDETLLSSVFSNGYIGDESSFSKSEVYYAAGNLSDSEVMSPTSRQSWDYVNRFGSPFSSSSFSHASYSPESSVCREAKKRLSERWAMMSLNGNVQEQRHVRRNSSTLGEMLALSDLNCKDTCELNTNRGQDADTDGSPKNLMRSTSLPATSTEFLKRKMDDTKDLAKEKSVKSSLFKGKVSSLFFSKSRKSSKQKSQKSDDEVHQSSRNIGPDGSQCISDLVIKDDDAVLAGEHLHKGGSSGNASENQDQPSPISVLELQFEDDEHTSGYSGTAKLKNLGIPNKCNLIDKSPPIGSIARALSWDDSAVVPVTPVLSKTSTKALSPEEEEQEWLLYVQTLLSIAGISNEVQSDSVIAGWHSPESPLDPSLRDTYMTQTDKAVDQFKQRHQRSFQRLVFDCVNEALTGGTHKDKERLATDHVWARIKEWLSGDGRCVWVGDDEEDDGGATTSVAVEWVVRKEVVGVFWAEQLRVQIDDIKMEIEEKLMEQLLEEVAVELTGRVVLA